MNRGKLTYFVLILLVIVSYTFSTQADPRLPHVIGSGMVMQRNIPLSVWGWADPGESIEVTFGGNTVSVKADSDGNWKTTLPEMEAGGPYRMTVSGKNTVTLNNILIGEVWVCSGQSNMQWAVNSVDNYRQEKASADYPEIRLMQIPRVTAGMPMYDATANWVECSSKTVGTFSAVAYFFGRELYNNLNIPIGLINTSWGGTRIEPWTPATGFEQIPTLDTISKTINNADAGYQKDIESFIVETKKWSALAGKAAKKGKTIPESPVKPVHYLDSRSRPTGIYNAMVAPLVPFAIRGAIWYQGEANRANGAIYHDKMKALIQGWRTAWDQGDFPFYFVQLAPFKYRPGIFPERLPIIWEAQTKILSMANTGMAVTVDVGNVNDIHPRNKQEVGKRLSLWALAKDYGKTDIVYSGPLYRNVRFSGGNAIIEFNHTGRGLITYDGNNPTWFTIAGQDKEFVAAQAEIKGGTVEVWSEDVPNPVAVRFGWHEEAEPNLMNSARLPASPFRTDTW